MKPSLNEILDAVISSYKINSDIFFNKSRNRDIVLFRHVFSYLAVIKYNYSIIDVGKFINKNKAAIWNSCKRIDGFLFYDKELKINIESIIKKINNIYNLDFFGYKIKLKIDTELFEEIKKYQSFDEFCQVRGYFPMYYPVHIEEKMSGFKGYVYRDFMTKSKQILDTDLCQSQDVCIYEMANIILNDIKKILKLFK